MKKYFFISLLLYGQFVLGQITVSQFAGNYSGIIKHSNTGGVTYDNDTAMVYTTGVDTIMLLGFFAGSEYYLHQDSSFIHTVTDYGHFYSTDSIYIFTRTGFPIQNYDEFHGKKIVSNAVYLNSGINEIVVYPNPANSTITIELNNISELNNNDNATIKNILGNSVITFRVKYSHQQIDVSTLPCGIYFIEVNTKYGILSKILIINR